MLFKVLRSLSYITVIALLSVNQAGAIDDLPADIILEDDMNEQSNIQDRFEKINRRAFIFNKGVDKLIINPAETVYGRVTVSNWGRDRVKNFLENMKGPGFMVNSIIYGDPSVFFKNGVRFLVNSTIGLGGVFDVASKLGVERHPISFADTMTDRMHMKNGQYLILPALGPSTVRNASGLVVDRLFLDPLTYILPFYASASLFGVEILTVKYEKRDILDQISKDAVDDYAMLRSLYLQSYSARETTAKNNKKH